MYYENYFFRFTGTYYYGKAVFQHSEMELTMKLAFIALAGMCISTYALAGQSCVGFSGSVVLSSCVRTDDTNNMVYITVQNSSSKTITVISRVYSCGSTCKQVRKYQLNVLPHQTTPSSRFMGTVGYYYYAVFESGVSLTGDIGTTGRVKLK